MYRKLLYTILLAVNSLISFSQDKLSKDEIYSLWCYSNENRNKIALCYDSTVLAVIDSIKRQRIDTIGIFSTTVYGSYLTKEKSKDGYVSRTTNIQWIKNGKSYNQKITKKNIYKAEEIEFSSLITYYINNKSAIEKEKIMPVIKGASINKKGNVSYQMQTTSGTTDYAIYCELNGDSKLTTFEKYYLENEDNLFYLNNTNSKINSWRKLIEKQMDGMKK
jgi:hypothetical protein